MDQKGQQEWMAAGAVPPGEGQTESGEKEIDLVELMYRILAGWKMIVCFALIGAILAGVATVYWMTPMYQATSTIYVLSRRDSAINFSDLQIGTALTADYLKVFNMWEVHEQVISNLSLPYSYGAIRKMLSVTNDSGTRMLDITVKSPSAEEAASIANEYAKVASQYIAETMSTDKPNIMSAALVPANPVSPSLTKNVVMGFMLGFILAVGFIAVRTAMDDKIKTAEDIRRCTGWVNLAVVPLEDGEGNPQPKKRKGGRR